MGRSYFAVCVGRRACASDTWEWMPSKLLACGHIHRRSRSAVLYDGIVTSLCLVCGTLGFLASRSPFFDGQLFHVAQVLGSIVAYRRTDGDI
jgi:hypothetical protein